MHLLKRLKNLWTLSGLQVTELSHDHENGMTYVGLQSLSQRKMATIIDTNETDVFSKPE